MPNYKNGKIYKIISKQTEDVYVGSTTITLSQRLANHRTDIKHIMKVNKKPYSAHNVVKHDDAKIILLEKFPCDSKEELLAREQHWQDQIKCCNTLCANWSVSKKYGYSYDKPHESILTKRIEKYKKDAENATSRIEQTCKRLQCVNEIEKAFKKG